MVHAAAVAARPRHDLRMNADARGSLHGQPGVEQVDGAVAVFRMLADATRVRLLWALRDGESWR